MKRRKGKSKTKQRRSSGAPARPRPKLLKISEEMRRWSALLGTEILTWPGLRTRPMFGLIVYYRGKKIFAGLPKTKAMRSPNSIIFKFQRPTKALVAALHRDPRVALSEMGGAGWQCFELASDGDLNDALGWLDRAYRAAA
ncbi:MAG: hypothetical protein ACRD2Q_10070 [Terriglobales bacterium]